MAVKRTPSILAFFRLFVRPLTHAGRSERGNVFFTLFGAVALVGVLGVAVTSFIRGPLSSMVEVNRRSQAEVQMSIAARLALLEAVEQTDDGDCDGDGFVEPVEYKAAGGNPAPTGGGNLPDAIGSTKTDPWGTLYGYCAWDAGVTIDNAGCDTDSSTTYERLDGTGDATQTYTVIAIVSAGADQTFQATCTEGPPLASKPTTSDDILLLFNYSEAVAATNGLWNLKSGVPSVAEIDKDLEVTGAAKFSGDVDLSDAGFGASAQLKLGAASMLFPTDDVLTTCDGSNLDLLRILNDADPHILQYCADTDATAGTNYQWVSVATGGGSAVWISIDSNRIYFDSAGATQVGIGNTSPDATLDVSGDAIIDSGIALMDSGATLSWDASSGSIGQSGGNSLVFDPDGGGAELTVAAALITLGLDTLIQGSTSDNTADALTVEDSGGTDIFIVQNDSKVGILNASPDDELDVTGAIDVTTGYEIDNATILYNNNVASSVLLGQGVAAPGVGTTTDYMNLGDVIHADLANKRVGVGFADSFDAPSSLSRTFEVNGTVYISGNTEIDGTSTLDGDVIATDGTLEIVDNVDVTGNIVASGNVTGTDLLATSEVYVISQVLGPPAECNDTTEKLDWADGSGWSCVTDQDGGGGGSGSGLFELSGTFVRTKDASAPWTSSDFIIGSGALDESGAANDARLFFDKSKGAFRAGEVDDTQWDAASVGDQSAAFGLNTTAVGVASMAWGSLSVAFGDTATAWGAGTNASAGNATAWGTSTTASGAVAATAWGLSTVSSDFYTTAFGNSTTASDNGATAWGLSTTAGGKYSTAFGQEVTATGDRSVAIGLGDNTGTAATVSATDSMGLFFGDQDSVDLSTSNIMSILGAKMIINPDTTSATPVIPDTGGTNDLDLHVVGTIGTTNYCDEAGNNCFMASAVGGSTSGIFEINGTIVRTKNADAPWVSSDFVIGSSQLDDTTDANHDKRMFFDKVSAAFRAGHVTDGEWDAASLGLYSSALGNGTTAEGTASMAWGTTNSATGSHSTAFGNLTTASGFTSTAFGYNTTATNSQATAFGRDTIASGLNSTAFGREASVSGNNSVAIGLGDPASNPIVSAADSMGLFFGDQATVDLATANVLGVFGGKMVIDPNIPATVLAPDTGGTNDLDFHVVGSIGTTNYCDEAGNNCFMASAVGSIDTFLELTDTPGSFTTDQLVRVNGAGDALIFTPISAIIFENNSGVVRTVDAEVDHESADTDFVFGAPQLDDTTTGNSDSRMQFDKGLSAFRAGSASVAQWDSASLGQYSAAFGQDNVADGTHTMAWGAGNTATGIASTAWGAFATAYGTYSTALGLETIATGDRSVAIGLGNTTGVNYPNVIADDSMALFFGDQATVDVTTSNILGVFGGKMVIDPNDPATILAPDTGGANDLDLHVVGTIGTTNYCDEDGDNCFTAASVGSASAFTDLTDTPVGLTADQLVRVNGAGDALIFTPISAIIFENNSGVVRTVDSEADWDTANLDFVFGSSQLDDTTDANHDSRMFFDKGESAFRAGLVQAGQWDATSLGQYSAAFGQNTTAEGSQSMAWGSGTTANDSQATAWGTNTTASNDYATAWGNATTATNLGATAFGVLSNATGLAATAWGGIANATNTYATAWGTSTTASSAQATAWGQSTTASTGANATAWGLSSQATAAQATAFGATTIASGITSTAFGQEVTAAGLRSVAIGLGDNTGTAATVSVADSMGLFFGDQDSVNLATSNVLGVFGGKMVIDPNVPATVLAPDTGGTNDLDLHVVGTIGTTNYCDEAGDNCFTAASVGSASAFTDLTDTPVGLTADQLVRVNGAGDALIFTPISAIIFENNSGVVRTLDAEVDHESANTDFVFGSSQLDDTTTASNDSRFMFDKGESAFRAGNVTGAEWDNTSLGQYSAAFGQNNVADNTWSMAWGFTNTASGAFSTAFGAGTAASTTGATAWGGSTTASGTYSTAFGFEATAAGARSVAIGLGNSGATFPTVSVDDAMGIFFGNQDSVDVNVSNVMSVLGAKMIINPDPTSATPAVPDTGGTNDLDLHVVGTIGTTNYCDEDGDNCFTAASVGGSALSDITAATGDATIASAANNIVWNWDLTGTETGFTFGESGPSAGGGASDQHILAAKTVGTSTAIPLFIDNVGAGASFRVDDASGDTTPFIVDAAGNVGIGTITTAAKLDIDAESNTTGIRLRGAAETVEIADIFVGGNGRLVLDTTVGTGTQSFIDLRPEDNQFGLILRESDGTGTSSYSNFYVTDAADDYLSINVGAATTTSALNITATNRVGIGTNAPSNGDQQLELDVEGDIGANNYCDAAGTNCFTAATAGSFIGLSDVDPANYTGATHQLVRVNAAADGLEFSAPSAIIFERNSDIIRTNNSEAPWDTVDFVFGSSDLNDIGADGYSRMFFDKGESAFRAGNVNATQWDNASLGQYSAAFGQNNVSDGSHAMVWGSTNTASGLADTAWGFFNTVSGGGVSTAWGSQNTASGTNSTVWGELNVSSGNKSTAFGEDVVASGTRSIAVGLGSSAAPKAEVSADSIGFFFGDQNSANIATSNIFGVIGGKMIINSDTSQATPIVPDTGGTNDLDLHVVGTIGTTNYCDEDGDNCFTAASVGSGSFIDLSDVDPANYTGATHQLVRVNAAADGLEFSAPSAIIFENNSGVVRTDNDEAAWASADFVFGSDQLDDNSGVAGAYDSRMLFDKDRYAFRAGLVTGAQWDAASRGQYSAAFGNNTVADADYAMAWGAGGTASGQAATAWGVSTTASNAAATAWGLANTASNIYTTAWGSSNTASGQYSTAFGFEAIASGDRSIAIGLGDSTATFPTVSGAGSLGIFMGDQQNIDVDDASTMAIVGGDFVVGSPQLDDTTTGSNDSRMFFDVSQSAFRAGLVGAAQWDNASIGQYSAAFGTDTVADANYTMAWNFGTTASGQAATAFGVNSTASGVGATVWGLSTTANNNYATAWGTSSTATNTYATAWGTSSTASGASATAWGSLGVVASGSGSTAWGSSATASGSTSTAFGQNVTAGNSNATALGFEAIASGARSISIGLGDTSSGDFPDNSGTGSMAIFMGDQDATTVGTADIFAVLGGKMIIDPAQPATITAPDTGGTNDLDLHVVGTIGTTNYCDEDGDNCFTAASVGGGGVFEVTGAAMSEVVSTVDADAPYQYADFVVGSSQLDDTGTAAHDNRMFFDKSKGAFRAGEVAGLEWNDASIGDNSTAFGLSNVADASQAMAWGWLNKASAQAATGWGVFSTSSGLGSTAWGGATTADTTYATAWGSGSKAIAGQATAWGSTTTASGTSATAWGSTTTASGQNSTAFGNSSVASGSTSFAFGFQTTASNTSSTAIGYEVISSGQRSIALGLGDSSSTFPTVSGTESLGIFMGDQTNIDLAANTTMAVIGGDFIVGSYQMDDTTNTAQDKRMFFDKATGAFRAGEARGTQWDTVGTDSTAFGRDATASGTGSMAWGYNGFGSGGTASGTAATAWGNATTATTTNATAWGLGADATGSSSTAWGNSTTASGTYATAFGQNTTATTTNATAWGNSADATSTNATAWGASTTASTNSNATAWGDSNTATGENATAWGFSSDATNTNATAFGRNTLASGSRSTAWGNTTISSNNYSTAWGNSTTASGDTSTAFGNEAIASGTRSIAIGLGDSTATFPTVSATGSVAFFFGDQQNVDVSTGNAFVIQGGMLGIDNIAPDVQLDVTGDIEYSGTITDVSDIRLKTDITPLQDRGSMLAKLDAIDTYSFRMKDDEDKKLEFGVIAQELEKTFPELVRTAKDEMGTKSVNYVGLIAPLIEAGKELNAENKALKSELETLKTNQETLTKQVNLLSKTTGQNAHKASTESWMMPAILMLLSMLAGGLLLGGITRYSSKP